MVAIEELEQLQSTSVDVTGRYRFGADVVDVNCRDSTAACRSPVPCTIPIGRSCNEKQTQIYDCVPYASEPTVAQI